MWKKVVCLFLILSFIITIVGCGGAPTAPPISPEPENSFSEEFVLVQVTDPESNIIFVTGKENEDAMAILGEKNIAGEPTNITGAVYVSEQGDSFVIEAGIDGLPIHAIDSEGNTVIFENYTNSTVDISIYDSNGISIQGLTTINVDPADLLELKQLYNSFYSKQRWSGKNTADVLKWGAVSLSWVGCISSGGLTVFSGGVLTPIMAYACGKAILSTIVAITPGDTDNIILMAIGTLSCVIGDLWSCVPTLLSVLAYGAGQSMTYTITASAGLHGFINPSGNVTVNQGSDKLFTITPDAGYQIEDVLIDGSSVGAVSSYTFTNVTEDHTISATFISEASGSVHNLSKDTYYDTIQAALDDADNDNTIEVADGTYVEYVNINKSITIKSENGAERTIVQARKQWDAYKKHVFEISADHVNLSGFKINGKYYGDAVASSGIHLDRAKHCNISHNIIYDIRSGISLLDSSDNFLDKNTIFSKSNEAGIALHRSSNNTLTNNIISSNYYWGICLTDSSDNVISNNVVSDNGNGIGLYNSSNNLLSNNTVKNNESGILLELSNDNTLTGNVVSNNNILYGIFFRLSSGNKIYLNSFINNKYNAFYLLWGSTNTWNSSEQITYTYNGKTYTNYLGNYWSDYVGNDGNNDGIGDTPYSVDGDQDSYPLMKPYSDTDFTVGQTSQLTPEEIELIGKWGFGGDYIIRRWPDGYLDVYDETHYTRMQDVLNEWNAAIGGPVVFHLSNDPNSPVKVKFDPDISQDLAGQYLVYCSDDDYEFYRADVNIQKNYLDSLNSDTKYCLYLWLFSGVAGFNIQADVDPNPFKEWWNFDKIPDVIKTMLRGLYKVPCGYNLPANKLKKNWDWPIFKNLQNIYEGGLYKLYK